MRIVVQRVSRAAVVAEGSTVGEIGRGLLLLIGVENGDTVTDMEVAAAKVADLRIFTDSRGLMNESVRDVSGEILVVSQFTLLGDVRRGRRPSFTAAEAPDRAHTLLDHFVDVLRGGDLPIQTGKFGAAMEVTLVNDGPVTLVLDFKDGRVR